MLILKTNFSLECIKCSRSLFVASKGHGQFEWLAFDTDQRLVDFKLSSFFDFVSSGSRLLVVSMVWHFFIVASLGYRTNDNDFELNFSQNVSTF